MTLDSDQAAHVSPHSRLRINGLPLRRRINIIDAGKRPPQFEHNLTVCVEPLFHFADAAMVVRYVETWRELGATRLHFYVRSCGEQVLRVLRAYERAGVVHIEDWSQLPPSSGDSYFNPNEHIYRVEEVIALNDCLLRQQHTARYTAFGALDEILC